MKMRVILMIYISLHCVYRNWLKLIRIGQRITVDIGKEKLIIHAGCASLAILFLWLILSPALLHLTLLQHYNGLLIMQIPFAYGMISLPFMRIQRIFILKMELEIFWNRERLNLTPHSKTSPVGSTIMMVALNSMINPLYIMCMENTLSIQDFFRK